jgi:hypothetical protein
MKVKILATLAFLAASTLASARVVVGVGVGVGVYAPPPPPPRVVSYPAPYARPGCGWVGGYWYPVGPRYAWRPGYCVRPPYTGAYWVAPRYYGHQYYHGYWYR